jgi:DNA-binding NtrC family response regulator
MLLTRNRAKRAAAPAGKPRGIAIFSRDESIVKLITDGLRGSWVIEKFSDPLQARASMLKSGVKIVVIDDEAIEEATRGWLLDQVRKWAPHALVAYIAAIHNPETERRAREHRVQYYTAKPMDRERTLRVLHSFERAAR